MKLANLTKLLPKFAKQAPGFDKMALPKQFSACSMQDQMPNDTHESGAPLSSSTSQLFRAHAEASVSHGSQAGGRGGHGCTALRGHLVIGRIDEISGGGRGTALPAPTASSALGHRRRRRRTRLQPEAGREAQPNHSLTTKSIGTKAPCRPPKPRPIRAAAPKLSC